MIDKFLIWAWENGKKIVLYTLWIVLLLGLAFYFYNQLTADDKTILIQGKTSNGHYQIEEKCDSCHVAKDKHELGDIKQDKCLACHKEKKRSNTKANSHRAKLFEADDKTEQRNILRADQCVTCHEEHQLGNAGTSQPADFCILCHKDIADDRDSHKDLAFDECGDCHNYHDNSANYSESFTKKHLGAEANTFEHSKIPKLQFSQRFNKKHISEPLSWEQKELPATVAANQAKDWEGSSHALAGVNCQSCHNDKNKQWLEKPDHNSCSSCHKTQLKGFLSGKHGMRLDQKLPNLTTGKARLPMKGNDKEISCISCHKDHKFDAKAAAVEGCLNCHNDEHSLAYKESKHYQLWKNKDELGVSCASCHMPKIEKGKKKNKSVLTQHNQNDNLRPNQKMAKSVCISCHGLGFSIDALQDESLINNNFVTPPSKHIPLIEMWNKYENDNK